MKSEGRMHNQAVGDTSNLDDKTMLTKKWLHRIQLATFTLIPLIIIITMVLSLTFILYKFNSELRMLKENFDDNFVKLKNNLLSTVKQDSISLQVERMRSSLEKIKKFSVLENSVEQQLNAIENEMYHLIPKGFVYTQLPGQREPKDLWPQFEWININHLYSINVNDTALFGKPKRKYSDSELDDLQKKQRLISYDQMGYKKDFPKTVHQLNYFNHIQFFKVIKLWQRI